MILFSGACIRHCIALLYLLDKQNMPPPEYSGQAAPSGYQGPPPPAYPQQSHPGYPNTPSAYPPQQTHTAQPTHYVQAPTTHGMLPRYPIIAISTSRRLFLDSCCIFRAFFFPVVVTAPTFTVGGGNLGDRPTCIQCPHCRAMVTTVIDRKLGLLPWLICLGLFIVG